VVPFPPRPDAIDFRNQLENKYTAMGRPSTQVYVDKEGEVVWIGDYDRYRVNGCDHNTATQYVMVQIDGAAPPPICAALVFPETAVYPERDYIVDFRRQLGTKYQGMGRSAQSAVDPEGAAIWTGEYYRYRTSGCDQATSVQKTLTQVDGNPAPETCLAQCTYAVDGRSVGPTGGTFSDVLDRRSGACEWLAQSEVPWIVLRQPITGGHRSNVTYTVAPNPGGPRTGRIRIDYPTGRANLDVSQGAASHNLAFQFFDPATSTQPTTECLIKTTATICTLNATSLLPAAIAGYDWQVSYAYGGSKVKTQTGVLSTLSFTESCSASAGAGAVIPIAVRLTATDVQGNIVTINSGQGSQPALQLRAFACP
jgi:hypothetical protein